MVFILDVVHCIGYMTVDASHGAVGQHVPMSSPSFRGHGDYCLSFDCKIWVSALELVKTPPPRLGVYIRTSSHVHSGWQLWTSNGTGDGHTQISVHIQAGLTYWIAFVGVVGHPDTSLISVANVRLLPNNCTILVCEEEGCKLAHENLFMFLNCKWDELNVIVINWLKKKLNTFNICVALPNIKCV